MERALRERWPIKPEYREKIIASLLLIVADRTASPRERTSAAKALLAADQINVEQEKLEQADDHAYRARLVEFAKHIPIGEVASIASQHGIAIEVQSGEGRAGEATPEDGDEAGDPA
jgi:hypothetical protein